MKKPLKTKLKGKDKPVKAPEQPLIHCEPGDYVIVKMAKGDPESDEVKYRKLAMLVYSVRGTEIAGADLKDLDKSEDWEVDDEKMIRVMPQSLLLNLGKRPETGSVYGCKIQLRQDKFDQSFGPVFSYLPNLSEKDRNIIVKGTKTVETMFREAGLGAIFPLRFEWHEPSGRYDGDYKPAKVENGEFDRVRFKPKVLGDENYIVHLAAHEFGHALETRLMHPKVHAKWIRLYHTYLVESEATEKQLRSVLRTLVKKGNIDLAASGMSADDEARLYAALAYVEEHHFINADRLNVLLENGEDITDLWPTTKLPVNLVESPIGEYSQKNPSEFFCEAIRLHFTKEKLPKPIARLVEETLRSMHSKSFSRTPVE